MLAPHLEISKLNSSGNKVYSQPSNRLSGFRFYDTDRSTKSCTRPSQLFKFVFPLLSTYTLFYKECTGVLWLGLCVDINLAVIKTKIYSILAYSSERFNLYLDINKCTMPMHQAE